MRRKRLFAAVPLDQANQALLAQHLLKVSAAWKQIKWSKAEQLHFTLAFIGAATEAQLPAIKAGLEQAAAASAPFNCRLGQLGYFPNQQRPAVVWLGLSEGAQHFITLAKRVQSELQRAGLELESRPFIPHLTLGRIKKTMRLSDSAALAQAATIPPACLRVERVLLMESILSASGAVYQTVEQFYLSTA